MTPENFPAGGGPLVSVIVPNYNYAESLDLCLRSILDQTYPDIEILMVDDCSTDQSVVVAEALGVPVVSTGVNGGCGRARNIGAAHTRGELLCYVDSDLVLAPDAVANAVRLIQDDSRIGAVCGIEDPEPLLHDTAVARYRGLQYHYWSISSEGDVSFLFPAVCVIRRDVFDEIGPFNPALRHTEEVDYGYRLTRRYRLVLTSGVRGRHDHDHQLRGLLRKLFHRGRLRIPLYARARRFGQGFETAARAWGSLAAFAVLPALAVPVLFGAWGAVVPIALLAASLGFDAGMYGFVRRRHGLPFLLYFAVLHFLVNVTITAGVATGAVQWLVSRTFRQLYDASFPVEGTALRGTA
ncbi:glycosyltransferase family 2 protein [Plantactinospora soyae]|uniref:Glycosyltransferase involved in cell wall biosynthesis n=1 Tax=Plantactinospora soyae TaxID=1544732 RepID=A0A927MAV6_9ACTN|nr:glycosyltransferase family 2 protein [Plantactinospora soyae]MBE1489791.1 glycosyltransferase involved in cell wall biosynthesis [Plantactinospora soyae]